MNKNEKTTKKTLEQQIEAIQQQIEQTTEPQMRVHLFLKKIELFKIKAQQIKTKPTIKQILEQLRKDLGDD